MRVWVVTCHLHISASKGSECSSWNKYGWL